MKQSGRHSHRSRFGRAAESIPRLAVGTRVLDLQADREGEILDCACQYAHPKAEPVLNYLIRWEDGQVQAMTEFSFARQHGLVPLD